MKRAALYVRVSTEEQRKHGLSVANQIKALEDYCIEHDYEIAGLYNDAGISARKSYKKRPALLQLIADSKQKKIDIVLFTKLDRFFRSVPDYYACVEQLKAPWRAIWEDYETETSAGMFKVNIMLSVAQAEADRTSERVKASVEYRRSLGNHHGSPPLGYIIKNKRLEFDEEMYPTIKAFFDTLISTHSSSMACDAAAKVSGKPFPIHRHYFMVKNPVYWGDDFGTKCPAYITIEQRDIIQKYSHHIIRKTSADRVYLFSTLVRCANCGLNYSGKFYDNHGHPTYMYRCQSRARRIKGCNRDVSEKRLENWLLENLENEIKSSIVEINTIKKQSGIIDIEKRTKALRQRLDRLGDRYELGDISKDEYFKKRQIIVEEMETVTFIEPKEPPKIPAEWKTIYNQLDRTHKRAFWSTIIETILWTGDFSTTRIIWV